MLQLLAYILTEKAVIARTACVFQPKCFLSPVRLMGVKHSKVNNTAYELSSKKSEWYEGSSKSRCLGQMEHEIFTQRVLWTSAFEPKKSKYLGSDWMCKMFSCHRKIKSSLLRWLNMSAGSWFYWNVWLRINEVYFAIFYIWCNQIVHFCLPKMLLQFC